LEEEGHSEVWTGIVVEGEEERDMVKAGPTRLTVIARRMRTDETREKRGGYKKKGRNGEEEVEVRELKKR